MSMYKRKKAAHGGKDKEEAVDARTDVDKLVNLTATVKPPHHLELSETELNEEFCRILTTSNPHAPKNVVCFSFKERCYKPVRFVAQTAVLFNLEGSIVHKDSDEARRVMRASLQKEYAPTENEAELDDRTETPATPFEERGEGKEVVDEERPDSAATKPKKEAKATNLFFIERASQTHRNVSMERSSQTEPPSRINFSATANQWKIYDAYLEELQKQEKNKEKQKTTLLKKDTSDSKKKVKLMETRRDDISKVEKVAKIVERAINRDLMDDRALKIFGDHSHEYKDQELSLHPLWMFQYNAVRNLSVTALCWNNKYLDLFAVGLRSYECRQGDGMVLFFSMKNPTVPEYIYSTPSGVCSLDIHPHHSYLLAVGFYDGCVAVYNLKKKEPHPVDRSTVKNGKHTDPVWQVRWQKDDMDGNHIFYSVSADSRVVSWTLVKHKLISTDIIRLTLKGAASDAQHAAQRSNFSTGRSMDFNKQINNLFLVGTEQGEIHKCSKIYSNLFLETYEAHNMPADTVKWNHFHPNIFISCSYDWTVKLWEHTINTPLLTIELYEPVADVAWAPYSSTVFAAATIDGKVHVFDLSISTEEAIHQQQVMEKETKPTRIEFNPIHPMIIVGDDKGNVASFKIIPNPHEKPKVKKDQEFANGPEAEVAKLDKVVNELLIWLDI